MDAATRAELDALRLRAYGPAADIADDPAALRRLSELEERALPAMPALPAAGSGSADPALAPPPDAVPTAARVIGVSAPAPDRGRPGWHTAAVVTVALVATTLGMTAAAGRLSPDAGPRAAATAAASTAAGSIPASVRDARAFVRSPDAETLIQVRIDGSFGDDVDIFSDDVPLFPVQGQMTWAEPLGEYYGWHLWIGSGEGLDGKEDCLLLEGEATLRAKCVPAGLKAQGALLVAVPHERLTPLDRPEQMRAGESLGFWWGSDSVVSIVLGPSKTDTTGLTSLMDTRTLDERAIGAATSVPVLIDRDTGSFIDLSALTDAPAVPTSGEMTWAQPLGEHFGWRLWVGSAASRRGDQHCIVLTDGSTTRAGCASGEWDAEGDLTVTLPFAQIDPDERPDGMSPDLSVAFIWDEAGRVDIGLSPTSTE